MNKLSTVNNVTVLNKSKSSDYRMVRFKSNARLREREKLFRMKGSNMPTVKEKSDEVLGICVLTYWCDI